MELSILNTIKKLLGFDTTYAAFDLDITLHINSAISNLTQVGVGPSTGYVITGTEETWQDFLGTGNGFEQAKMYIYMKTRLIFDPPQTGAAMQAMEKVAEEYLTRLNLAADYKEVTNDVF